MAPKVIHWILLPFPLPHKDVKLFLTTLKVVLFHWKNHPAMSETIHVGEIQRTGVA